jgi:hypothetical protein
MKLCESQFKNMHVRDLNSPFWQEIFRYLSEFANTNFTDRIELRGDSGVYHLLGRRFGMNKHEISLFIGIIKKENLIERPKHSRIIILVGGINGNTKSITMHTEK